MFNLHSLDIVGLPLLFRFASIAGAKIARTAEHSRTGKAIPKGVISQFEAAEAKKDREIEKVKPSQNRYFVHVVGMIAPTSSLSWH